jgi:FAD/FMN-containing dehydrogenase
VIDAVNFSRENGLPLAVRCGGHSVAGKGVVDDGVLIDLSNLKCVRVDPKSRRARANAGALWGEFDRETQIFGLATPGDGLRRLVSVASRWEAATAGSLRSGV